ncbi:uncharacterized protein BP5553_00005 [Venustampulla echinocandica]|uniref:Uncharacterized protein n=1 Tax=Venustampulla echinocandica TaxID=2656787 RepID=A0A370TWW7_9HELO|nr:uncharacterized protein BP5553_00005 [Venustampulla echinocandica]RDL40026.1 hypothetical protein BP5553_00005 [Venustampulla echinocandica]
MRDHKRRSLAAGRAAFTLLFIAQYASAQRFLNNSTAIGFSTFQFSSSTVTTSSSTISIPSTGTEIISSNSSSSSALVSTGSSTMTTTSNAITSSATTSTSSISSSVATGNSSSSSIISSSTRPSPTGVSIGIITSVIVQSGTTITKDVLTGGSLTAPITLPPVTTTFVSSEATSAVSSVSSQIIGILPIIIAWKKDPIPLQTDTLNKINRIKGTVDNLISSLGTKPSSKPCSQKKKRGLFGIIGDVANALTCITSELENVTKNIKGGIIEGVDIILSNIQSETEELTEEEENETDSKSDTSTSSDGSCTATQTAFRVTVLCGPTTYTTMGKAVSITTCSSTATVTTTGCTATGRTITISSSAPSATQTVCASGTCGDACPLAGGPLSGASMGIGATTVNGKMISTSALPTASYGAVGNGASKRELFNSPIDYNGTLVDNSKSLFERALPDVAALYTNYVSSLSINANWVSQHGLTSGIWYNYPNAGIAIVGVNGIYGCTAVVIASELGVYLSHIWEDPVFVTGDDQTPTDDASFISNTFNALRDGTANARSITALIGTYAQPGVLHAIYSSKKITTPLKYQARAEDLASRLARLIPGSGGSGFTTGYTRTNATKSTKRFGVAGRAILEVDPYQSWITTFAADQDPNDFWVPNTTPPTAIVARDVGHPNPCKGQISSKPTSSSQSTTTSSSSNTSSSQTSLISTSSSSNSSTISSTTSVTTSSNSTTKTDSTLTTSISSIHNVTSTSSSSRSRTSAPLITSCTLSNQGALSTGNINIPATIACNCNDGWTAGIGSRVGDNEYTTYTCQVGTGTSIAVKTVAAPTPTPAPAPAPAFKSGTCNIHIFEASNGVANPFFVGLQITDGGGAVLARKNFQVKWSETATISKAGSKLPYDLNVEFSKSSKALKRGLNRRAGGAPPGALQYLYQNWVVGVTAGGTKWDSTQRDKAKMPYCNVGGWDNGDFGDFLDGLLSLGADSHAPTRQMDCRWAC